MEVTETRNTHDVITLMDIVILSKLIVTSTCPFPECESCNLLRAKTRKPKAGKHKAIKSD